MHSSVPDDSYRSKVFGTYDIKIVPNKRQPRSFELNVVKAIKGQTVVDSIIFGPRHQRSKALMEKVQAKYGPAHAIGHSLGGHLAEHSGAQGLILAVDKAVGLRDLGPQSNPNELDIRARGDVVSALSRGGLREEVAAPPSVELNRSIPLPVRAPATFVANALRAHNFRLIR